MKVMCIVSGKWRRNGYIIIEHPKMMETVTVTGSTDDEFGYDLAEYPHPDFPKYGWCKKAFIPLSSIDETEIAEQRINQLQTT